MGVKCPNKGAKWRLLREHATLLVSNDSPNPLRSSLCLVISYRCICVFFCIAGTAYRSDLLCGKDVKDGGPCPPYENSFGPGLRTYVESGDCTNGLGESLRSVFGNSVVIRSIFSTCNALGQDGLPTLPDVPPSVCYPSGRHRQRRRPKPGRQRN